MESERTESRREFLRKLGITLTGLSGLATYGGLTASSYYSRKLDQASKTSEADVPQNNGAVNINYNRDRNPEKEADLKKLETNAATARVITALGFTDMVAFAGLTSQLYDGNSD
ncbi:MAG: hypothetical protein WC796_05970 [Candidatus Pacearchaeota archaeon]